MYVRLYLGPRGKGAPLHNCQNIFHLWTREPQPFVLIVFPGIRPTPIKLALPYPRLRLFSTHPLLLPLSLVPPPPKKKNLTLWETFKFKFNSKLVRAHLSLFFMSTFPICYCNTHIIQKPEGGTRKTCQPPSLLSTLICLHPLIPPRMLNENVQCFRGVLIYATLSPLLC